jgi:hypothetical protein
VIVVVEPGTVRPGVVTVVVLAGVTVVDVPPGVIVVVVPPVAVVTVVVLPGVVWTVVLPGIVITLVEVVTFTIGEPNPPVPVYDARLPVMLIVWASTNPLPAPRPPPEIEASPCSANMLPVTVFELPCRLRLPLSATNTGVLLGAPAGVYGENVLLLPLTLIDPDANHE